MVWDGSNWVLNSCWSRAPSGRAISELKDLQQLVRGISLQVGKNDQWEWSMGAKGVFKTCILSKKLDCCIISNSSTSSGALRNVLVPKNVEVFIWRVLKGRIPVLVELDKRGVDLHSARCTNCDNDIECISRSLLSCEKVNNVWKKIFDWWEVTRPPILDLRPLLEGNLGQFSSDVGKKVWQAVIWTCVYLMRKFRNEKVFKKKDWCVPVAVCDIQIKSFEWVAKRYKTQAIYWNSWLHNPRNISFN
ncbi:uncharacterized protein [Rutidosis leptorrhynchoides]|uniref:uncharacterized protein n=1 Tax=Rutidosis leptorrhynchoides TaxID=125765 RepID=UPI003A9989D7